ncbi:hypothetical protein J2800_003101 [Caulobacter rhizosphaerae]|uniref:Glycosyltransferase n=1 Tax=Caulobacter rhizosphaerae TaxID=2010972 RepID=A0ABU1N1L8_9CAUL|nr:hypothetical protein [Caulobacter rhizosphaerae]MDR6532345.1 hypothetical protein [Caulobacter rhizosphaerae]
MTAGVGIAMALKNVSGALDHAIQSMRAFGVTEIAVSDASGDPSVRERFAPVADLITAYFAEPDGGQSHGLDKAFRALRSPVVGWLNHDDFLVRDGADAVLRALETHDVVYGEAEFLNMRGEVVGYHPNVSDDLARLGRENLIAQPSCFFRNALYRDVGGLDYDLHYTMDWDLWIRMAQAGAAIAYTPALLSGVTLDPDAKTAKLSLSRAREIQGFLSRSGASLGERTNLIVESMKTALLWKLRGDTPGHPYFTVWAHKHGSRRASAVAEGNRVSVFSLEPVDGEVLVWRRGADQADRAIRVQVANAAAFQPVTLELPFAITDLGRVRFEVG